MASSVVDRRAAPPLTDQTHLLTAVPWPVVGVVAAATCFTVGLYWDLSWHATLGRDSFWTPAHVVIYFCGILAGISCGYMILRTTFRPVASERAASVRVWGFHAPLGAFIAAWGGIVMLTAAGFDNWWHAAYGLDAKLNSPPHWCLVTGVTGVQLGGIVLLAASMNRSAAAARKKLEFLFLYLGTMIILLQLVLPNHRILEHSAICYAAVCGVAPGILIAMAEASRRRWACTIIAAMYMVCGMVQVWIFPLFPASPKLGPVYQHITHFIPQEFPLLIIVPAFLWDLVRAKLPGINRWLMSVVLGVVFLGGFIAAQWTFADFLMSPWARNWFFGTTYLPYFTQPTSHSALNEFYPGAASPMQFWLVMATALGLAIVTTRIGLAFADWLHKVRR
ncbi:MAG: hypothetical protein ACRD3L_00775 [Terriglobales bacterium]